MTTELNFKTIDSINMAKHSFREMIGKMNNMKSLFISMGNIREF